MHEEPQKETRYGAKKRRKKYDNYVARMDAHLVHEEMQEKNIMCHTKTNEKEHNLATKK